MNKYGFKFVSSLVLEIIAEKMNLMLCIRLQGSLKM